MSPITAAATTTTATISPSLTVVILNAIYGTVVDYGQEHVVCSCSQSNADGDALLFLHRLIVHDLDVKGQRSGGPVNALPGSQKPSEVYEIGSSGGCGGNNVRVISLSTL